MTVEDDIFYSINFGTDVMHLITSEINVNAVNQDNVSLLMHALVHSRYDVARALLILGADPNIVRSNNHMSPLMQLCWTAAADQKELLHLLLDCGADVNAIDIDGWTPLIFSSAGEHAEVACILLDRGVEIDKIERRNIVVTHTSGGISKRPQDMPLRTFIETLALTQHDFLDLLSLIDAHNKSGLAVKATLQNDVRPRRNISL